MKTDKKLHSIVSMAFILIFLGLMSATVTHAETYTFVTKWGSYGTGDGQFNYPDGVAVDSSNNVYVADTGNNRIQKFDSNGTFITKWGSFGTGDGQFRTPWSIAVDSSSNIYVADQNNYRIQKFDSKGNYLTQFGSFGSGDGQLWNPSGVAVDSSGDIYVADTYNSRVEKFDSNGVFLTKWGSVGSVDGQFRGPCGITVDSLGNVYVADTGNCRVEKFDSNGIFLTKWGSSGIIDGKFSYPYSVAVDSLGNVYVVDRNHNDRIQKFDSNGVFITKWGFYGTADGQFNGPTGVAVDSFGNVYVADTSNHRIQKFSKEKITPTIIWSKPADIIYGTALSNTQFNAEVSVPGTFVYTPPSGTVLEVGTHTLHVDFTPTDTANYNISSKDVIINVLEKPVLPVSNFSTNVSQGYAPLSVQFADLSKNSTSRNWDFENDGNIDSVEEAPVYVYTTPGTYTVNLKAANENGTSSKLTTITVLKQPLPPVASFRSNVTNGYAPLTVQFTDLSEDATEWSWDFGDKTYSTEQNPVHTYSKDQKYTVSLTVKNSLGTDTVQKDKYILVSKIK